jgi:hypothetical protein
MLRREGAAGAGVVLSFLDLFETGVETEVVQLLRVETGPEGVGAAGLAPSVRPP